MTVLELFTSTFVRYATAILPWFVVGSALAYFVEKYFTPDVIRKYFGKVGWKKLVAAQALGMISPLSIMSFLPVAGSLVALGAQPGLLLGYLVAERAYDLQSFFIVQSLFGIRFAVLNLAVVFVAATVASFAVRRDPVRFDKKGKEGNGFWVRQLKTLLIVMIGITAGAALRAMIPEALFSSVTHVPAQGLAAALVLGLVLYFGPLLGNYPVAKSFADLGMAKVGVFAFITVSPVFNLVLFTLFASVTRPKYVAKHFAVYTAVALGLTLLVARWL